MPEFKKMTVQSLRELARKVIGPGATRLKTKTELVNALEAAGATPPVEERPAARVRAAATRAAEATGKAVKAAARAATRGARAAAETAEAVKPVARRAKAAAKGARPARAGKAEKIAKVEKVEKVKEAATRGGKRMASRTTRAVGKAVKAAAAAVAAVEAAVGEVKKNAARPAAARKGPKGKGGPDPEGYFVARVRGEEAVRAAPHPLAETETDEAPDLEEGTPGPTPPYDEELGDLPWGYADDAFVALPRDPRTLFLYWDHSNGAVKGAFSGLDRPRAQLWIFARSGAGWERVRVVEFALESRGYYVHDLDPGRVYRAEIHLVDRLGHDRRVGPPSNETVLPPVGPSRLVDDRFVRIPWDVPLGRLLGPGHVGGPFSEEARALLARLSDWSRFATKAVWGGSAGEGNERPSSPTQAASAPTSPTSPSGGFGPRE